MFTKEFSGDRKHLLADAPCQVSSFFAVGTDVASLLDMAREVAHLVQPGIEKLGRRGRKANDHQCFHSYTYHVSI